MVTLVEFLYHHGPLQGPLGCKHWRTATESLSLAQSAYAGFTYTKEGVNGKNYWRFELSDEEDYRKLRAQKQEEQVVKAGARLAQLLNTIWPKQMA